MTYKTEKEVFEVIDNFKNCTIERGTWGHPEHLILAYHYLSNNDFETALNKMRDGIFRLLESFEIDLTKEMPYHETMTVFWMRTLEGFIDSNKCNSVIETINEIIETFDKNYPLRFYSKECLFSDEARIKLVHPDKAFN